MRISIIGTGYVGLVTGTCFSEMGHSVVCVDTDQNKIDALREGIIPIYEPGLQELVSKNLQEGRLLFTTSMAEAVEQANLHFIAVGTPPGEDGSTNLSSVLTVAKKLGQCLTKEYNVIVDKSTVPVGTANKVCSVVQNEILARKKNIKIDVVSNPEFLKEGNAINDFMRPDRVVIGHDNPKAGNYLRELYAPFMRNHEVIIEVGLSVII